MGLKRRAPPEKQEMAESDPESEVTELSKFLMALGIEFGPRIFPNGSIDFGLGFSPALVCLIGVSLRVFELSPFMIHFLWQGSASAAKLAPEAAALFQEETARGQG